jgi:ketosteroid isomerase-like protein
MSEENVELVRRGYELFAATGDVADELATSDFVWDMSNFHGWPEQQVYEGVEGARAFLGEWTGAWEHWVLEVDSFHDAGDKVVALVHQHGRSKAAGMPVEMHFAQVWTLREGKQSRMDMYSDPAEALEAAGVSR